MSQWWPILLGWPSVLFGLSLGSFGVFRKKPGMLYVAAVFILPMSLYLAATPRFAGITLLLPAALTVAGVSLRNNQVNLAFTLVLGITLFFVWLAMVLV